MTSQPQLQEVKVSVLAATFIHLSGFLTASRRNWVETFAFINVIRGRGQLSCGQIFDYSVTSWLKMLSPSLLANCWHDLQDDQMQVSPGGKTLIKLVPEPQDSLCFGFIMWSPARGQADRSACSLMNLMRTRHLCLHPALRRIFASLPWNATPPLRARNWFWYTN